MMTEDELRIIRATRLKEAVLVKADSELASTRERVLTELRGRLWHTTHPDRFSAILTSGAILPDPPIPNPDGWKTLGGDDYCPYAHKLGGISLFDFNQFDPKRSAERCPLSSWYEFVPYRMVWGGAVWIKEESFRQNGLGRGVGGEGEIGFGHQANRARQISSGFVATGLFDDVVSGEWGHAEALPQRRPEHALIAHVALENHQHLAEGFGQHVNVSDGGLFAVARR